MESVKRVAVITGGGSGIGRAIAEIFTANGDQAVIIGRRKSVLEQTAREIGENCDWQQADVSQRDQVSNAEALIIRKYGKIDVLVNNAGFVLGQKTETPLQEAEQAWDAEIGTILKGAFLMTMALAPVMRRPGGRIINISSIAAFTGGSRPGAIGYAAAKAGLLGLTYALSRELSPQGITVNSIAPGFIEDTEFTGNWSEERVNGIVAQTPAGRAGQGKDVAAAVFFLASPEAAFITGEVLNVNGGWLFGR